mgnify:CR=1 FL=1
MTIITRLEIMQHPERWIRYVWNGEEIFREKPQYGNRDVRFHPIGSEIGSIHLDKFNAISQPISHSAHWAHEKTGINEGLLRLLGYGLSAYAGYRVGKFALKKFS